jgi:glycogen operon protein
MLLAGDEFGHTQHGNNNAYAQDNQIGWTDWSGLDADPEFATDVCRLLTIRRELPFFRNADADLRWYRSDGTPMRSLDWDHARAMTALFRMPDEPEECRAALCINAWIDPVPFVLPAITGVPWQRLFSSGQATETSGEPELIVAAHSLVMLAQLPGTVSQTRP